VVELHYEEGASRFRCNHIRNSYISFMQFSHGLGDKSYNMAGSEMIEVAKK
jgi:hypothetical protein